MTLKNIVFYIILLGGVISVFAQDISQLGFIPRINYLKPLNDHFSLNFTAFSEMDVADDRFDFPAKVINVTFVGGVSYKLKLNSVITAGYLFRIIDPFETEHRNEHRFISQFVQFQHFGSLRLRHHLRFEERFIERVNSNRFDPITRLSYSLGLDIPLQGKHLDAGEFYLNSVSSYFVQPTRRRRNSFNNLSEFYLGLGYKTKNIGRFEIGPEAKISTRNPNKDLLTFIFIDLTWYPSFKRAKIKKTQ